MKRVPNLTITHFTAYMYKLRIIIHFLFPGRSADSNLLNVTYLFHDVSYPSHLITLSTIQATGRQTRGVFKNRAERKWISQGSFSSRNRCLSSSSLILSFTEFEDPPMLPPARCSSANIDGREPTSAREPAPGIASRKKLLTCSGRTLFSEHCGCWCEIRHSPGRS